MLFVLCAVDVDTNVVEGDARSDARRRRACELEFTGGLDDGIDHNILIITHPRLSWR